MDTKCNLAEMRILRKMCGVIRMDKIKTLKFESNVAPMNNKMRK